MRFRAPLAAAIPGTGSMAQTVTPKLHHYLPSQPNQQKFWFGSWAQQLEQEPGGKLKVEIYPSMQRGGRQRQWSTSSRRRRARTPVVFPALRCSSCRFLSHAIGEKTAPAVWEFHQT